MPTVRFVNEKREIEVPEGANLRQEAIKAEIGVYRLRHRLTNCRGKGMCATCRVLIRKGIEHASPMGIREAARLKASMVYIGHEENMRLSCMTKVQGDMEVETQPALNLFGEKFWG